MNTSKDLIKCKKPEFMRYRDSANSRCAVSGSLALVLRVSRALGMSPLSVTRARASWLVAPSSTLALLQRLLMAVCSTVTLAGLVWDLSLETPARILCGPSTLRAVMWTSDFSLVMLITSLAIYKGPSRMESLIQVLKQLQKINFSLKLNPPSVKAETMRSFVIICMLTWSMGLQIADVYSLTQEALDADKMWPIMGLSVTYNYANIVEVMVALQWYYAACGAHAAAAALNQQLQHLCDVNLKPDSNSAQDNSFTAPQSVLTLVNSFLMPTKNSEEVPKQQVLATIRRLALSYARVSEVMIQMSADNGLILILIIASNSLRLVLSPYYILLNVFDDDDVVAWSVLLQSNWIAFHILKLILLVEPCHWTYEQREHTELLLSRLTAHLAPKSECVSEELDKFMQQVSLNKAKFMPLGICMLSRPLIVTILGNVTTYLIIMIQFQKISTQL